MNLKVSSTVEVSSLLRKKSTKTSSSVFGPFPEFIKLDFSTSTFWFPLLSKSRFDI